MKNTKKIVPINKSKITIVKLTENWEITKKTNTKPTFTLELAENNLENYKIGLKLINNGYKDSEVIRLLQDFLNFENLYLNRYCLISNNDILLNLFYSNGRNSIWDNFRKKTGLISTEASSCKKNEVTDEHFIPRKIISKILYRIRSIQKINFEEYVELLELLAKTIILSKNEHTKVTTKTRSTDVPSFIIYELDDIDIPGFKDYLKQITKKLKSKYNFDLYKFFNVKRSN